MFEGARYGKRLLHLIEIPGEVSKKNKVLLSKILNTEMKIEYGLAKSKEYEKLNKISK